MTWDEDACQSGLTIADEGATLRWIVPPLGRAPLWLGAQARERLAAGRFHWEVAIATVGRQLGIGIMLDPPDWGFFGYLGAGHNAWAYDPHEGAIVTETRAIHHGLPRVDGTGRISIELDLLSEHTCTFVVNGERTPSIALPPGGVVIPAACLLAVGQEVRSLAFTVLERGAVANAADGQARFEEQRELLESRDRVPEGPTDDEQLQIFARMTRLEPRNWEAWRWYAFYLGRVNQHAEQLECWDALLAGLPASDPYGPHAPQRDSEPARQSLARAIGAQGYYLVEKVRCLARLGRHDEMLVLMDTVLELPLDSYARKDMGDVLFEGGAFERAVGLYDDVVRQNPRFIHAYTQMGKCLVHLGRAEAAVEVLRRAFNQNKLGPRELAAWVLFQSGREAEAAEVLREHFAVHRVFYPLDDDRTTVCGFKVDDRYREWVAAMAARYGAR